VTNECETDRLIFLSEALDLVPFSETTLRRAISRGDLEAWQPSRDGKLVMWRSALVEWATRRPATVYGPHHDERPPETAIRRARRPRPGRGTPEPIRLSDLVGRSERNHLA
jgi:hypothetical protein